MARLTLLLGFLWTLGYFSLSASQDTSKAPTAPPNNPTTLPLATTSTSITTSRVPSATTIVGQTPSLSNSVSTKPTTVIATQPAIVLPTTLKATSGAINTSPSATIKSALPSPGATPTKIPESPTSPALTTQGSSGSVGTTSPVTTITPTTKNTETTTKSIGNTKTIITTLKTITTSDITSNVTADPMAGVTGQTTPSPTTSNATDQNETDKPRIKDETTVGPGTTHPSPTSSTLPGVEMDNSSKSNTSPPAISSSVTPAPPIKTSPMTTSSNASVLIVTPQDPVQVICKLTKYEKSQIVLNMIPQQYCGSLGQGRAPGTKEERILSDNLCKAIKPGFQPSTDKCSVTLGYDDQGSKTVVLDVVVESRSEPSDIYAKLKHLKNSNGSPMFTYGSELVDEDWLSMPLIITIVCLAVSLLIIAAVYGCWHQRQTHKRDQRLTEELQTMENGYHDNPTLEVMETSPEIQEKKAGLNGELGDSWIVPLDNLREDLEDEEDTHL